MSLRVNLAVSYQVNDATQLISHYCDYKDNIYRELQFGLREAIGTPSLDELLEDKQTLFVVEKKPRQHTH